MTSKKWAAIGALIAATLTFPATVATASAPAAPAPQRQATPQAKAIKVATRVVKGTMQTGKFLPASFRYSIKAPTLTGAKAKVKKAFDAKVDKLIAAELAYYAEAAITEADFNDLLAETGGVISRADYLKMCHKTFEPLKGSFSSAVYKGRYASTVLTLTGLNAPCGQLGGLWVGYQSDRSVTIDTKTGKFLGLKAFTSNAKGKVGAALKEWYRSTSHLFLSKAPKARKDLKVCDRPGNTITVALVHKPCYIEPYSKSGLVAWQVKDAGLRLTFPAGDGPRHILIKWNAIPKLR